MADNRDAESRSALMSRIRGKDTAPELFVRRLLHSMGYRFRLHRKDLPGTPDIVFPSRQKAVFVNGCFWHGHGCKIGQPPKTRADFWLSKLERNRARDHRNIDDLQRLGWKALVVWQCETRDPERLAATLGRFLAGG
jgi:DNA mismatch endonuclease (patch repair protein)